MTVDQLPGAGRSSSTDVPELQRLKDWGLRLADHSRRACPLLGVARRSMPEG